ncbi:MAG: methyltransferase domain-containing protein [Planctomycetota bacterium]
MSDRDYVLGTHDAELVRLGVQHAAWRDTVLACWQRAGIKPGARVADVGCGPGYATRDLATLVGPEGHVVAIDRSRRFIEAARETLPRERRGQVEFHERDLMQAPLPAQELDAVWCRWVACFVESPARLVDRMLAALRPGGVAIFHEYVAYETYGPVGRSPKLTEFVAEVMASWREAGGEPNIARQLPQLLSEHGATVVDLEPHLFCVTAADPMWAWPIGFMETNLERMVDTGTVDPAWAEAARAELKALCADDAAAMLTPTVLEIIAQKDAA